MEHFYVILGIAAVTYAVGYLVTALRGLFYTHTAIVFRETDQGENVTFHANFNVFDDELSKKEKLDQLFKLGETRHEFVVSRFHQVISEKQEENKKLKAVQGN